MTWTRRRTARKQHSCEGCLQPIRPGDVHLEHVASPRHDANSSGTFWRLRECTECAIRYGRGQLLGAAA